MRGQGDGSRTIIIPYSARCPISSSVLILPALDAAFQGPIPGGNDSSGESSIEFAAGFSRKPQLVSLRRPRLLGLAALVHLSLPPFCIPSARHEDREDAATLATGRIILFWQGEILMTRAASNFEAPSKRSIPVFYSASAA